MSSVLIIIVCIAAVIVAMGGVLILRHLRQKQEEARPVPSGDPITLADQISQLTDDSK